MKQGLELRSHSSDLSFNHGGFFFSFLGLMSVCLSKFFECEVIEVNTTKNVPSPKIQ